MSKTQSIVRKSKFRHVFAQTPKRDVVFDGIKMTKNAWDSNFVSVNSTYIAVAWQVGGGGAVAVLPVAKPGKIDNPGLFTGHSSAVLDLAFSPFNDRILATVSEDSYGKIWEIPKEGKFERIDTPVQNLKGHKRKVGALDWNGVAENVLATAGTDYEVKVWDVSTGQDKITVGGHGGIIQSLNWNYTGSTIVTFCKDKKMRLVDPRTNKITGEVETHQGTKGGRAIWMGKHEMIVSVGFSKSAEREYMIFDPRNFEKVISRAGIDNAAGVLMPFYDEDTEILFLAGKGDGNLRYYEVEVEGAENAQVHFISQYSSNEPAAGCGFMPKRGCDVNTNEIVRLYKQTGSLLQPLSFKVPRKSDLFQDDIFPPCRSDEPALSGAQWFSGETCSGPKTKSLEGGFVKTEKGDVSFSKAEEEKPLSEDELRKAHAELSKRVAYLEAELAKRDARIKDLEASH
jgi:coronin-1B/1C/6